MSKPSFWDDQERSRQILSIIYHAERITDRLNDLRNRAERLAETAEMIRRHNDAAGLPRLASSFEQMERDVSLAELELFTSEGDTAETDAVFIAISPVTAPKAQHPMGWPAQLRDMYIAWAKRKGYEVESIGETEAQPVLLLRGPNLERILAGEGGIHKLQREKEGQKERSHNGLQVQLALVEVLAAPRKDHYPFTPESITVVPGVDGHDHESKEGKGQTLQIAEATEWNSNLRVRVRAQRAEETVLAWLAARLIRQNAQAPASDEVVRIYHLARTQYARDPRTAWRSGRPRDVLAGTIDDFLLAYLKQQAEVEAAPDALAAEDTSGDEPMV